MFNKDVIMFKVTWCCGEESHPKYLKWGSVTNVLSTVKLV